MRSLFIINPKAGDGKRIEILKNEISVLSEKENCEIYLTKGVRDATRYVSEYLNRHADEEVRCIACGGDGTLNEVVNGAVGHANASVSVYPIGSGNDFVKSVGGAEKFLSAEALIHAPVREIDLLKAGEHYSINVINFGFDTAVAITVNEDRDRTGHGNRNSYTKGIVKALMTNMRNAGTVKADGETLDPSGKFLLCTIANGQYIGGKFLCAPHADLNDGLMEGLFRRKPDNFAEMSNAFDLLVTGDMDAENITSIKSSRFSFRTDTPTQWTLDGEDGGIRTSVDSSRSPCCFPEMIK